MRHTRRPLVLFTSYLAACSCFNLLLAFELGLFQPILYKDDKVSFILRPAITWQDLLFSLQIPGLLISAMALLGFIIDDRVQKGFQTRTLLSVLAYLIGIYWVIFGTTTSVIETTWRHGHEVIVSIPYVNYDPINLLIMVLSDCWLCLGLTCIPLISWKRKHVIIYIVLGSLVLLAMLISWLYAPSSLLSPPIFAKVPGA
jgi:hypothetical protein